MPDHSSYRDVSLPGSGIRVLCPAAKDYFRPAFLLWILYCVIVGIQFLIIPTVSGPAGEAIVRLRVGSIAFMFVFFATAFIWQHKAMEKTRRKFSALVQPNHLLMGSAISFSPWGVKREHWLLLRADQLELVRNRKKPDQREFIPLTQVGSIVLPGSKRNRTLIIHIRNALPLKPQQLQLTVWNREEWKEAILKAKEELPALNLHEIQYPRETFL